MVSFTKTAIEKLEGALDSTDYVRVAVAAGGCSGLRYSLMIEGEDDKRSGDIIVEFGNIKVCVDPNSSEMLSHTVVDYVETIGSAGFQFDNQKASTSCGCGASFSETQGCPS